MWLIQSSLVLVAGSIAQVRQSAEVSEKIQAYEVIPCRQEENPQHNRQPKPESDVLGPLTERPPQNTFECIVQKMAPVEQRNGKKVDQPNAYRK